MADDKEIDELPAASAFTGSEVYHVGQSGNSRQATTAQQRTYTLSNINQDMIPDGDGTRDLGSDPSATPTAGKAWAKVWADNYGDSDGLEVPSKFITNGTSKIWCNFNGTGTPAIRGSFYVDSLTDIAIGNQSVNFTSDMNDTDYAHFGSGSFYYSTGWGSANWSVGSYSPELGSVKIHTIHNNGLYDFQNVNLSVSGNLA